MTKTILPLCEGEQVELERRANALLGAADEETWETWPGPWPEREETELDRIAAAHTGMVPLSWVPIVAALPSFDPDLNRRDLESLMQERPGRERPDHYGELLSLLLQAEESGEQYGSGFTVERRSSPPDSCQWPGCREPLYASQAPRKRGRPRKHCQAHQKAAKTRRKADQRRGVLVGRNRNLVYDFEGLEEQDLSGYRELWGQINTTGR
ncbi:hypothetical protein AB0N17_31470 [Streptomyces sp. NPDC051133]|uniref:hypothetical protein n=1 Tax=Streptomyces sp. NPDC051133 TaxID=3155521 RepID=UPI00342A1831